MQSPKDLAHFLIDEAVEQSGKIEVAVEIVAKFRSLSKTSIIAHVIGKLGPSRPAKTNSNAILFLKSLADRWTKRGQVCCTN
jgi:hypothetical protein